MKRVVSVFLVLVLLSQVILTVNAANTYHINGVDVRYSDYTSKPNDCWNYANNFYKKIWGVNFNNSFTESSNSLRGLSDEDLTLTADHLKEYVTNAALGSCLRICDEEYLHGSDGWGHSQIIVQKDSNGFTVFEGGLSSEPYCREKYYTWNEYINTKFLGKYEYIKYIKWPGAEKYEVSSNHIDVSYRSFGTVRVTSDDSWIKTMPCSRQSDPASDDVEVAYKGDEYRVIRMVRNEFGNYWYKVARLNGGDTAIGYLYAGDVDFFAESDIEKSNVYVSNEIETGSAPTISGILTSAHTKIMEIEVQICYDGTPDLADYGHAETDAVKYDLSNICMNALPTGEYDVYIVVGVKSGYSPDGTSYGSAMAYDWIYEADLSVKDTLTCSHSFTATVTAPTYTSKGYTTYTCTKCGYNYKSDYTDMLIQLHKIDFQPNGASLPEPIGFNVLNGINIQREKNYLVVYNSSGELIDTNEYGIEVLVDANNLVIGKRDYLSETKQRVPEGGFILSGQGTMGTWVGEIQIGQYVAYDDSAMCVRVYDSRSTFELYEKKVPHGQVLGYLPKLTRENYIFDGWYDLYGEFLYTEETIIYEDTTLYAQWTPATCSDGHSFTTIVAVEPTFTNEGLLQASCEVCGNLYTVTLPVIDDQNYSLASGGKNPTCLDAGYEYYFWNNTEYGAVFVKIPIAPLGPEAHCYSGTFVSMYPTFTSVGELLVSCPICNDAFYVTLPIISDVDYRLTQTLVEQTCEEYGIAEYTWLNYEWGVFSFQVDLAPLGHSFTHYASNSDSTCDKDGTKTARCDRCSVTDTVIDNGSAKGHVWIDADCVTPETCSVCGANLGEPLGHSFIEGSCVRCDEEATLVGIQVLSLPTKTTYEVGEPLNIAGLTLQAIYHEGTPKNIADGFEISGFDSSEPGVKSVIVIYRGMTTVFTVTVNEAILPESAIELELSEGHGVVGSVVRMKLSISNLPEGGISSLDLSLRYDPAQLKLLSVPEDGGILGDHLFGNNISLIPYGLTWNNLENFTEEGVLVTLEFEILDMPEDGIIHVWVEGNECSNLNENVYPITDAEGVITKGLPGDVNGDGKITQLDVTRLRKYLAGGWDVEIDMSAADVNGDGKITQLDVTRLRKYLAGGWDVTLG